MALHLSRQTILLCAFLCYMVCRFIHANDQERSSIFKMIPHIEVGPWVLKQTVGTTPVIMGRKLETTYHLTHKYMEVDIDVTTCKTAGYIVQVGGLQSLLVTDYNILWLWLMVWFL